MIKGTVTLWVTLPLHWKAAALVSPRPTDTRVFLAVQPDPALRSALCRLRRRLLPPRDPGWRLVEARDLHLTLRFFGNLPPPGGDPGIPWRERLGDACSQLAARHAAFEVRFEGIALWRARGPRPLVIGIAPNDALRALATEAEALAVELGFPAETRGWKPHITLARATARAGPLRTLDVDWPTLPLLRIASLALMHSRPQPAATRYEAIWRQRRRQR